MPVDQSLVGRTFPPAPPYEVTEERIRDFADAVGASYDGGAAPPTFPIAQWFAAMGVMLETEAVDLARIIHGEQRFSYERPVVPGDVLTTALTVTSLRSIGDNDVVGTSSEVVDADGALVCTMVATLVHRRAS
jgi:acyl dehydratase